MKRASHIPVPERTVQRAKAMRTNQTEAEKRLWRAVRQRLPLEGTHFRRQVPIAGFITDFCCLAARLVVEVDGNQHGTDDALAFDARRTALIEAQGFRVLRFSNVDVFHSLESVLDTIFVAVAERTPTPNPSPQGGGEERPWHG